MKITKTQLKEIIKEEVSRFQTINSLQKRKKQINEELRILNEENLITESINEPLPEFLTKKFLPKLKEAGLKFLPPEGISGEIGSRHPEWAQVKELENGCAYAYVNKGGNEYAQIIVNLSKKDVLSNAVKHFGLTEGRAASKDAQGEGGGFTGKRQVGGGDTSNSGDIIIGNAGGPHASGGVWFLQLDVSKPKA